MLVNDGSPFRDIGFDRRKIWPADKEWPSWCQQVYPEGKATSVVHTKQVQSWITLNTECVTPLRESHNPFKAVYDAI